MTTSPRDDNRSLAERGYNIQRWTHMPQGGHFAALEARHAQSALVEYGHRLGRDEESQRLYQKTEAGSSIPLSGGECWEFKKVLDRLSIFLRDCQKSVLYSSKVVVRLFAKLHTLTSHAVR